MSWLSSLSLRRFAKGSAAVSAALTAVLLVNDVGAQQPPPQNPQARAEAEAKRAVSYRQAAFKMISWNLGPMGQMAQGKAPFNAEEFANRARRVSALTPMVLEGFAVESHGVANSRAKPEIWQDMEDFKKMMQDMVDKSKTLADAATANATKGGDMAAIKSEFDAMGKTCGGCHKKYRGDHKD